MFIKFLSLLSVLFVSVVVSGIVKEKANSEGAGILTMLALSGFLMYKFNLLAYTY